MEGMHIINKASSGQNLTPVKPVHKYQLIINPFLGNVFLYALWKLQKTKGFLIFSGYENGGLGKKGLKVLKQPLSFFDLRHALPLKLPNIYFLSKKSWLVTSCFWYAKYNN